MLSHDSLALLFVKAPLRGQVKSRLAAALGEDAALELYRNFALDMLQAMDDAGIPNIIFFHPPDAANEVANWLGEERSYQKQHGSDVGERMEEAFRYVFSRGCSRAVLVGSDIPDLPGGMLTGALHALADHDAVIGPAEDGGYYLIGFRSDSFLPEVFHGIPWSTDAVFRTTTAVLERAGRTVSRMPLWRDVDTIQDLRALQDRNRGADFEKSRTMTWVANIGNKIWEREDSRAAI